MVKSDARPAAVVRRPPRSIAWVLVLASAAAVVLIGPGRHGSRPLAASGGALNVARATSRRSFFGAVLTVVSLGAARAALDLPAAAG